LFEADSPELPARIVIATALRMGGQQALEFSGRSTLAAERIH